MPSKNKNILIIDSNFKKPDIIHKHELKSNLEKPKKDKKKDEDIQEKKLKIFV